jgi:glycosyltransferase involved in cell wall biosynthesis
MMLRTLDETGGIAVYTQNLIPALLTLDQRNEYVFFYRNEAQLGRFAHHPNVTERLVKAPNKVWWDQIAIPYACWREKIDVVFHPKFTLPLLSPCPAVMVVHGADWFIPEQAQYYHYLDVKYLQTVMPLYFKKASIVISVSQLTTDNFYQVLDLPDGKLKTIYFAPARHFQRVTDKTLLAETRARYNLPEKFILTLTKRQGDGRKNLGQIFKAYRQYHQSTPAPHKLVVGGKDCHLFRDEYGLAQEAAGQDILFPGWIDQADLPAVYSLADLYLYPSNLEAFPIPITEAMACGTPIVTSNANGLVEIAGDAAIFVDPTDAPAIAEAINRVLTDDNLQTSLSKKGLARSTLFTWEKCAQSTLETLENLVSNQGQVYVR